MGRLFVSVTECPVFQYLHENFLSVRAACMNSGIFRMIKENHGLALNFVIADT